MIRVLFDESNGCSVVIYPSAKLPLVCKVGWPEGFAFVFVGTWEVLGGGELPIEISEWLKSNEIYLWKIFEFYLS
jgi:hypothetical protein